MEENGIMGSRKRGRPRNVDLDPMILASRKQQPKKPVSEERRLINELSSPGRRLKLLKLAITKHGFIEFLKICFPDKADYVSPKYLLKSLELIDRLLTDKFLVSRLSLFVGSSNDKSIEASEMEEQRTGDPGILPDLHPETLGKHDTATVPDGGHNRTVSI